MPSNKTPDNVQVGPGRLPANVVPTSAIVQTVPLGGGSSASATAPTILNVSTTTALGDDLGPNAIILVDSSSGAFTITLPNQPDPKSFITFIQVNSSSPNVVTIDGQGADQIHGSSQFEFLTGLWGSRTFFNRSSGDTFGDWMVTAEKPSVQSVSTATTLRRAGTTSYVLVDVSGGSYTITLPASYVVGDMLTFIVTTMGSTNILTLDASGVGEIDGSTSGITVGAQGTDQYEIVTVTPDGTGDWFSFNYDRVINLGAVLATTTLSPARHTALLVNATGITINLATAGKAGDRVDVFSGNSSGPSFTVAGNLPGALTSWEIGKEQAVVSFVRDPFGEWYPVDDGLPTTIAVTNTIVLSRLSQHLIVHVDTTNASWGGIGTSDLVTLPDTGIVGDRVTIVDVGGLAGTLSGSNLDFIRVDSPVGTINGLSEYNIGVDYGSATFTHVGSGNWITAGTSDPQYSIVTFTLASSILRVTKNLTVLVDTSSGGWTGGEITLYANGLTGDTVTIKDSGGLAGTSPAKFIQINPGGNTIEGSSSDYNIDSNYGSVTLQYDEVSTNWSVVSKVAKNPIDYKSVFFNGHVGR